MSTSGQSIILNGLNDIKVRNYKVICEVHPNVLKLFLFLLLFINNCTFDLVQILRKWLSFDLHAAKAFVYNSNDCNDNDNNNDNENDI